jgi:hypothetical protein
MSLLIVFKRSIAKASLKLSLLFKGGIVREISSNKVIRDKFEIAKSKRRLL